MEHLELVLRVEALKEVHPLKAINPEVLAAVLLGALVKGQLAVVLQGVVPAAMDGLGKIIIQAKVQQNVPLYQYLYPLALDHIMVGAIWEYLYFRLSLD